MKKSCEIKVGGQQMAAMMSMLIMAVSVAPISKLVVPSDN